MKLPDDHVLRTATCTALGPVPRVFAQLPVLGARLFHSLQMPPLSLKVPFAHVLPLRTPESPDSSLRALSRLPRAVRTPPRAVASPNTERESELRSQASTNQERKRKGRCPDGQGAIRLDARMAAIAISSSSGRLVPVRSGHERTARSIRLYDSSSMPVAALCLTCPSESSESILAAVPLHHAQHDLAALGRGTRTLGPLHAPSSPAPALLSG